MQLRALVTFLRDNPQAAILLTICLILGLGTLIAVMISMATSHSSGVSAGGTSDGGVIMLMQLL
jgi:hypothetical protein